jgi:hypothetical protein
VEVRGLEEAARVAAAEGVAVSGWRLLGAGAGVVGGAATLLLVGAAPAAAHAVGIGATPTNYRTIIVSVSPPVPGLSVRMLQAGNKLQLINHSGQQVVVLGYDGEPYLRVGPLGVDENQRAPSTYLNRSALPQTRQRVPAQADPAALPRWRHVASQPVAIWHDHRAHWSATSPPLQVRAAPGREQVVVPAWQVPLRVGSRTVLISGQIVWVPGPSPWPWLGLAALLCAAGLLASRSVWTRPALAAVTAGAVAADVVHATGTWLGSAAPVATKLGVNATTAAVWALAAVAVERLLRGRGATARMLLLLAGIFLVVGDAAPDIFTLTRSQLPSGLPAVWTRAAVAMTLGLGTAMVLGVLLRPRRRDREELPLRADSAVRTAGPREPGSRPLAGG